MENDLLYKVALGNIPNVGSKNSKNLIAYCGSAEEVFKQPKGKLLKVPGIGQKIASHILEKSTLESAEKEINRAIKEDVELLFFTDSNYPKRLKHIDDAPPLLYYKGKADLDSLKVLSVVGTRNMTDYGKSVCEKIIENISGQNVLIVSGLAYGVDICTHRLALKNNLPTVGVMANGMDKIYPSQHRKTANEMVENGGLLTEEPFGTPANAPRFPARNRIVAGMSDATLVIESAVKGGSLITADIAFGYDKEVFAVPGDVGKKYSEGCNELIKTEKARLVSSARDVLEFLNWDLDKEPKVVQTIDFSEYSIEQQKVLNILKKEQQIAIDDLTWKTQLSPNQLASILLNLEFEGMVDAMPGKKYKLKL